MVKSAMARKRFREVFIFIAGTTPQVITETICVLCRDEVPVCPEELYIITTAAGRKRIKETLCGEGILNRLAAECGMPPIPLEEASFIVPAGISGAPLGDIQSASENELMGDCIMSFIREKSADSAARLHCSLAGGRKTMSFYLGAALQLFGRPWDKLYHVLVSPEFEANPHFFYKPKADTVIEHNGVKLNTGDAEIVLAELPFIRLRDKLPLGETSFRKLVIEGQQEIDIAAVQPGLRISLHEGMVYVGRKTVRLQPVHLVLYVAYLKYKLQRCKYPERPYCLDCADCSPQLVELTTKAAIEELAKDYMVISPSKVSDFLHKNREGLSIEAIRQAISKIKRAFIEQLEDESLAARYAITTVFRGYANTRHGIKAEKGKIRIEK